MTPTQLVGYGIAFAGVMYYNYKKVREAARIIGLRHALFPLVTCSQAKQHV